MNSSRSGETLTTLLAGVAAAHPRVPATFWSVSERVDYAELSLRAQTAATALVRRGIGHGEPVGVLCPNAPEFLVSLFGIAAAGGAATPLPLPAGARATAAYPAKLAANRGDTST
ncbi:AMP-binding protein, partial [Nocardia sp. NPDC003354]